MKDIKMLKNIYLGYFIQSNYIEIRFQLFDEKIILT